MDSPLKLKLNDDLKQAMRAGDSLRCSVIRMVLSALKYKEGAKVQAILASMNFTEVARQAELHGTPMPPGFDHAEIAKQVTITDDDIRGVIAREIKQRKESVEAYTQAKRPDLAAKEDAEMAILKAYLPEQMNREEIVTLVRKIIAETGAQGPRDKNNVMPKLMPLVKGKADGQEVNAVVTELLGS